MKRDFPERKVLKPKPGAAITEDKVKKLFVSTVIRWDTSPGIVGDQRRTTGVITLREQRR